MKSFIITAILTTLVSIIIVPSAQSQQFGGYGQGSGWGGYGQNFQNAGQSYFGQQGAGGQGAYAPNFYNSQNQPLSPYLNLTRGGNTAVNYFYGVRPGTQAGGFMMPYGISQGNYLRAPFFPQSETMYDLENVKQTDGMLPTGHPFAFNNQLGYFGTGGGMGSRGQSQGQGQGPISQSRTR
jgi:hypothetical protein